jgi:hypothetical protein
MLFNKQYYAYDYFISITSKRLSMITVKGVHIATIAVSATIASTLIYNRSKITQFIASFFSTTNGSTPPRLSPSQIRTLDRSYSDVHIALAKVKRLTAAGKDTGEAKAYLIQVKKSADLIRDRFSANLRN